MYTTHPTLLNQLYTHYSSPKNHHPVSVPSQAIPHAIRSRDPCQDDGRRPHRSVGPTTGTHLPEAGGWKWMRYTLKKRISLKNKNLSFELPYNQSSMKGGPHGLEVMQTHGNREVFRWNLGLAKSTFRHFHLSLSKLRSWYYKFAKKRRWISSGSGNRNRCRF